MDDLIWGTNHISLCSVTGREECQFRIWQMYWYQLDQFQAAAVMQLKGRMEWLVVQMAMTREMHPGMSSKT
jgi:hypothetical protein